MRFYFLNRTRSHGPKPETQLRPRKQIRVQIIWILSKYIIPIEVLLITIIMSVANKDANMHFVQKDDLNKYTDF